MVKIVVIGALEILDDDDDDDDEDDGTHVRTNFSQKGLQNEWPFMRIADWRKATSQVSIRLVNNG